MRARSRADEAQAIWRSEGAGRYAGARDAGGCVARCAALRARTHARVCGQPQQALGQPREAASGGWLTAGMRGIFAIFHKKFFSATNKKDWKPKQPKPTSPAMMPHISGHIINVLLPPLPFPSPASLYRL
ncbi:hypothetical protein KFK09_018928 [Dendrobium nobile]|uniref:Uncharacterized protein n=1 Tax=Dendrobium nobile TaxID=94219 RepID=A0A8T3AYG4_DENNO|nr:hypothetical protein KFK09_018928 [Dendrobium nobile]